MDSESLSIPSHLIILVGVMNSMWMAIRERTQEIGTLRAIGMGRGGVLSMFVIEASLLSFGATIAGVHTDPVTYLIYLLANGHESLEDERSLANGAMLLDFRSRPGESMDSLLTRFDMARHESEAVGAGVHNIHLLATLLIRASGDPEIIWCCYYNPSWVGCPRPKLNTTSL